MDDAMARATAKVALQILVLASAGRGGGVTIPFAQALDIVDWADTDPAAYRAALGGQWQPFIESAFDRLAAQEMIGGKVDYLRKEFEVGTMPGVQAKLDEVVEGGKSRRDIIAAALAAARNRRPDAPGPFVEMGREIGLEPCSADEDPR